jgi:hypothetical protein
MAVDSFDTTAQHPFNNADPAKAAKVAQRFSPIEAQIAVPNLVPTRVITAYRRVSHKGVLSCHAIV